MRRAFDKTLIYLIFFFFLQVGLSSFIIRSVLIKDIKNSLNKSVEKINDTLKVEKNGQWDTDLYDSDPETPHPSGSSGYPKSLYIFSTDGYVIERNKPIKDYLDSSDHKKLLDYEKPRTIETVINKKYRVLSRPIKFENKIVGVLLVSFYNPIESKLKEIDELLQNNLLIIEGQIKIKDDDIDVKNFDIRTVDYNVAFEVVSKHNIVLVNNGRVPTFIDPSYVNKEISNSPQEKIIKTNSGEFFFVVKKTIFDNINHPLGIIILGESLQSFYKLLNLFIIYSLLVNIFIIFPLIIFTNRALGKSHLPNHIYFDKNSGILKTDNLEVHYPYASNQYYLLLTVFKNPKKRFELDELLEKFGVDPDPSNWRKVYDAMLAVNKKLPFKLIIHKDKAFFLNPDIASKL